MKTPHQHFAEHLRRVAKLAERMATQTEAGVYDPINAAALEDMAKEVPFMAKELTWDTIADVTLVMGNHVTTGFETIEKGRELRREEAAREKPPELTEGE